MPGTMFSQLTGMSDQRFVDFCVAMPAAVARDVHPFSQRVLLGLECSSARRAGANEDPRHGALHLGAFADSFECNWL